MATLNSAVYAQAIGAPSTATGLATPIPNFSDGKRNGGKKRAILVSFDTALQNLAINDVINVAVLPPDVIPTDIKVIMDTATASLAVQLGITGTAAYFSTSAIAMATAAKFDAFTKLSNFGTALPSAAPTTVIATITGAAVSTGKIYFVIEYLSN